VISSSRFSAIGIAALLFVTPAGNALAAPEHFPKPVALGATPQLIAENDDNAQLVGVQVFLRGGLERQTVATAGIAALTAECILRTPVGHNGPLVDSISQDGGAIDYALDGRSVLYYLEARPAQIDSIVSQLAEAFAHPDFSQATIASARAALVPRASQYESNPILLATEMARQGYYLNGIGAPIYGNAATLASLGPAQLQDFFGRTYRRGGLSVTVAGASVPNATETFASLERALPEGNPAPAERKVKTLTTKLTRIVSRRDVAGPMTAIAFAAPDPSSSLFGAMLIVQALLSSAFDQGAGSTPTLLRRSIGALYEYDASPASFVVYINGLRVDRNIGIGEVLLVTKSLAQSKMTADSLTKLKAQARGIFIDSAMTLSDRAYLIGSLTDQGLPPDALNAELEAIDRTTGADVQRVAKLYLQKFIVAEVLPRQGQGG